MFVCLTNDTTYLTGNEGQKFRAVLSENAPLRVCPAPRVLPLHAMERPTEGTYGKLWREKANKLMCLPRHHMVPMERHFARNFEDKAFSGSFKV